MRIKIIKRLLSETKKGLTKDHHQNPIWWVGMRGPLCNSIGEDPKEGSLFSVEQGMWFFLVSAVFLII